MAEEERDWQVGKSLPQCNRYLLDSGILSDVTFHVGQPEGPREMISAHKVFLVARSPVFEAMFCGDLSVRNGDTISIDDIEPGIFKDLLMYLYTDEVVLTKDSALHVLYAAKKYIVTTLEAQCSCFLKDNIGADTSCTILTHANKFQHSELEEKCLKYVQLNTKSVFESEDFVNLSHATLCLILGKDELEIVNEIDLLKFCIKWAKAQLDKKCSEVSDKGVRDTLGAAVFLVRLPSADMKEFAAEFGASQILSDAEKLQICLFGLSKGGVVDGKVAGFSVSARTGTEPRSINRFGDCSNEHLWKCNGSVDAICLSVDKPVFLVGITLYSTKNASSFTSVKIEVYDLDTQQCLSMTDLYDVPCSGSSTPIPVHLAAPLHLTAGKKYTLAVTVRGNQSFQGQQGKPEINEHGCTVRFFKSTRSRNGSDDTRGQIPGILYRLV